MNNIKVEGMTCNGCAKSVKKSVEKYGFTDVNVDLKSKLVTFNGELDDARLSQIKSSIEDLGYDVVETK